jgi:hypothetical protein
MNWISAARRICVTAHPERLVFHLRADAVARIVDAGPSGPARIATDKAG